MEKIVLDTNVLIEILKGNAAATARVTSFQVPLYISSITAMELYYGALNKNEMKKLERFIATFTLSYPDEKVSHRALLLIKQYAKSHCLDIPDSIIAATALVLDAPLLTYNLKDFHYIDGLEVLSFPK